MSLPENEYGPDYAVILGLLILQSASDNQDAETFARLLHTMWLHVLAMIPEKHRQEVPVLVLEQYFHHHGNTRKALAELEELFVARVGYERHRDALSRLGATDYHERIKQQLKENAP